MDLINQKNAGQPVDRVFINGRIYTMDRDRSWAEAIAVKNGRFIDVGSTSGVSEHIGPDTEVIDLDAVVPDRPVSLMSEDGHAAWVNSKTMALAGVTKDITCPRGGVIEVNFSTGEPSGTFRETPRDLIQNVLPPFTVEQIKGSIQNFMTEADMVVLENNLFDIPIFEIADTKVLMTLFEGQTVYRDVSL